MSPLGRRQLRTIVLRGDGAAPKPTWDEVARQHGRFIYTVAYRLTNNHADAEDLTQEVMMRVQRGLATYQPGSFEGWLACITTNAFLDDTRRRKRRPVDPLGEDAEWRLPTSPSSEEASAMVGLPADLQSALASLPEDFRVAVVLCDVVGLTYEEIAEQIEVPIGTVRSRIHRGRVQLRGKVQQ